MLRALRSDTDYITSETDKVLDEYGRLVKSLAPIGELAEVHPAGELSGDEAKNTADELLEALDEFDDEESKKLAGKLTGYPFRINQKEKLKSAIRYIDDFLYDEAADIIREIYSSIE